MLRLKPQYFSHLMQRVDSLEKTLMLGGIGGRRRRERPRMRWLGGITDSMDVSLEWTPGVGDGQGVLACCNSWGRKEMDTTERLNWKTQGKVNIDFPCARSFPYFISLYYIPHEVSKITPNFFIKLIRHKEIFFNMQSLPATKSGTRSSYWIQLFSTYCCLLVVVA